MSAPSARLSRTLYKSLLRSARRMDELIPTPLFSKELSAFDLPSNIPLNLSTKSFSATVKKNFRSALKFAPRDEETTMELQDIALKNLSIVSAAGWGPSWGGRRLRVSLSHTFVHPLSFLLSPFPLPFLCRPTLELPH